MLSGLTAAEQALFAAGLEDFAETDNIAAGFGTAHEAAIAAHQSGGNNKYQAWEANKVIDNYSQLSQSQHQDLLNFLRSL
jgi:hypothetical protein